MIFLLLFNGGQFAMPVIVDEDGIGAIVPYDISHSSKLIARTDPIGGGPNYIALALRICLGFLGVVINAIRT
jgi:hypothetical protein